MRLRHEASGFGFGAFAFVGGLYLVGNGYPMLGFITAITAALLMSLVVS